LEIEHVREHGSILDFPRAAKSFLAIIEVYFSYFKTELDTFSSAREMGQGT
jgi:hypothetical protein